MEEQINSFQSGSSRVESQPRPTEALDEVIVHFKGLLRGEIDLAKEELKEAGSRAGKYSAMMIAFGLLAAVGVLPLVSFMVIGLGRILNDNFWLSSLLVSILLFAIGGGLAYGFFKKLKKTDLSLAQTRHNLRADASVVQAKVTHLPERIKRGHAL